MALSRLPRTGWPNCRLKAHERGKDRRFAQGPDLHRLSRVIRSARQRFSVKYAKENNKLVILGGAMGESVLDTNAVRALAELPSLDELRANLDWPAAGARNQDCPRRSRSPARSLRACSRPRARKRREAPKTSQTQTLAPRGAPRNDTFED